MSSRRILIISYSLPPYPGIGGRRWAKFAKYLKQNGEQVWLLSAENPFAVKSEWVRDIEGIPAMHFKSRYPSVLAAYPKTITEKIRYRINRFRLESAVPGNFYDRAARDKAVILEQAGRLIASNRITHVIVSGAPFHLLHHALELKKSNPNIKLIGDLRDPWTTDVSVSVMTSLSAVRKAAEMKMEREVAQGYDLIITVAEALSTHFRSISSKQKVVSIPNGFDPEDIKNSGRPVTTETITGVVRIVFAGTIYNGVANLFNAFCSALREVESSDGNLKVQVDFAGDVPQQYKATLASLEGSKKVAVTYHGFIPLQEVHDLIRKADYGLLMIAPGYEFSFSTKFLEYVMHHKRVIVLGKSGELSEYVVRNQIGFVFDEGEVTAGLKPLLEKKDKQVPISTQVIDQDFDVRNQTLRLINELNHLK